MLDVRIVDTYISITINKGLNIILILKLILKNKINALNNPF